MSNEDELRRDEINEKLDKLRVMWINVQQIENYKLADKIQRKMQQVEANLNT